MEGGKGGVTSLGSPLTSLRKKGKSATIQIALEAPPLMKPEGRFNSDQGGGEKRGRAQTVRT